MNGEFLKAWQGLQDGFNPANPPLAPVNVERHLLEGCLGRMEVSSISPARHTRGLLAADTALEQAGAALAAWC